ncbi:MAG: hypothetical protein WB586_18635 [Chthoniobacterales bacterium]
MTEYRIVLNPQSKGNLGKSFFLEPLTNWYAAHKIEWSGADLDDRHTLSASGTPKESARPKTPGSPGFVLRLDSEEAVRDHIDKARPIKRASTPILRSHLATWPQIWQPLFRQLV